MRELRKLIPLAALAVATALPMAAAAEAGPGAVLGSEGELYRLALGTYGELTGEAAAREAAYPVLALHIQQPDGGETLHMVPGSVGPEVENTPFLLYENASRTAFLAWEERINYIHSRIRLVGFRGGEWTEVINVSEGAFGFKGSPRLAATRDSFVVQDADGAEHAVARTILHVVWVEERSEGQRVSYAPVTLLDGEELGHRTILDLSALLPESEPLSADLWQAAAPAIEAADDDHSVVVGLVDPRGGGVSSLRITMLPGELSIIADELRNHLIDVGARSEWQSPEGLARLADELRNHLIDVGHRLDPQILRHIASDLRNHLIDVGVHYPPSELTRMARDLRNHLIDVGFRLDERGLRRVASGVASQVIDVAAVADDDEGAALPTMSQIAQVAVVDGWPRPVEATADSLLMLSSDGQEALLTWADGSSVFYRETFGNEWSSVHRLPVGKGLDADEALAVLHNRIRNR